MGRPADGDVVDLLTHDGKFVARGLWNSQSRLRVRLYAFDRRRSPSTTPSGRTRLEAAVALRRSLGLDDRPAACRLVNSEGDDLSGLIVDRYGDYLAVQVTALAMQPRLELICDLLESRVRPRGILLRGAERGLSKLEGLHLPDRLLRGAAPDGPVFVEEHGLKFGVDLTEGQKTGFYLDQRDNRQAAARLCPRPPGARHVLLLRRLRPGLRRARRGGRACWPSTPAPRRRPWSRPTPRSTGRPTIAVETADAFEKLDALAAAGERFGMVVLDPPKFARSRAALDDALRAYHRINRVACDLLEPGGILVTCSCSGSVMPRRLPPDARRRRPAGRPHAPAARGPRRRGRSSGQRQLPGGRVSQVRDRPRGVTDRGPPQVGQAHAISWDASWGRRALLGTSPRRERTLAPESCLLARETRLASWRRLAQYAALFRRPDPSPCRPSGSRLRRCANQAAIYGRTASIR